MMVSLSFSPVCPEVDSVWAVLWCSCFSSWARPARKSETVICGVDEGSDPPPVACGLVTPRQEPGHGYGVWAMDVIVLDPTLPGEPACTAITLACAVPPPHGTVVAPDCWAKAMPFELMSLCPLSPTKPGLLQPAWGQVGFGMEFVYTTAPVAGASGTWISPVVLKPCGFDFDMTTDRTLIVPLPGWAGISTSFCAKGAACAVSVMEAEGT